MGGTMELYDLVSSLFFVTVQYIDNEAHHSHPLALYFVYIEFNASAMMLLIKGVRENSR